MMEATLLTKEQVLGDKKLSIFEKINAKCAITDFAIVLDSYVSDRYVDYDNTLKGRTDWYYLLDPCIIAKVQCVDPNGSNGKIPAAARDGGVRPVLPLSNTFLNNIKENNGLTEVEYGEYPQYVVSTSMENELDQAYRNDNLRKTGKIYTSDFRNWDDYNLPFQAKEHEEYEYNGKRYIRICYNNSDKYKLSNGKEYEKEDYVWLEVAPLTWYVDTVANVLVSKNLIASGIRFCDNNKYDGNFKNTEMYMFLNNYFLKDIMPEIEYKKIIEEKKERKRRTRKNKSIWF